MRKKGFTLLELIIVLTIVTILWTIEYFSYQWYSKSARDTTRISDVQNIWKFLDIFTLQTWKYPLPDNAEAVTYAWETIWYQWTLWDNVIDQLSKNLKQKPIDPLLKAEYIYSVSASQAVYEMAMLHERDITYSLLPQTYAIDIPTVRVDGIYNELYAKTSNYIIPLPSIITAEPILPWSWMVLNSVNIKSQVVSGFPNIPSSWPIKTQTWWLDIVLSVYSWGIDYSSSDEEKVALIIAIQNAYSGSVLSNIGVYNALLSLSWCGDLVGFANIAFWWWNIDPNACVDFEPEPEPEPEPEDPLILLTECELAGWFWVDASNDMYIGTTQWSWFCISPRIWDFWDGNQDGISWNGWWKNNGPSYKWWNASPIDDSWNSPSHFWQTKQLDSEDGYSCKPLWTATSDYDTTDGNGDTLYNRMKWLTMNKANKTQLQDIDWIIDATPPNGHPIPALYLSDCIDGTKDISSTLTYIHNDDVTDEITYLEYSVNESSDTGTPDLSSPIYQNRQRYLTAWTQKSWSHLPSAFSYISYGTPGGCESATCDNLTWNARWEYQLACEAWELIDGNDDSDKEWIWMSALGTIEGEGWVQTARIIGDSCCATQNDIRTWHRKWNRSARFVVRP